MPEPKKLFTQEFRDEAVRLAQTSGRSRREVGADLGIGLSTLRNWIDRRRDRQIEQPPPDGQEDTAAELKRMRRENEVLRQERDILKRATAFFAKEAKSMRFKLIDAAKEEFPLPEPVQGSRSEPKRLLRLAEPSRLSAAARGPRAAGPCPLGLPAVERDLRQPAHDTRAAGCRPRCGSASNGSADARERAQSPVVLSRYAHHREP